MKFLCRNCKAKYQIADEKVAGRTLRMTCQQCSEPIVVRGPARQAPTGGRPIVGGGNLAGTGPSALLNTDLSQGVQIHGGHAVAHAAHAHGGHAAHALAAPARELGTAHEEWHVAINDAPVGPLRRDEVARMIAQGAVDRESLAWREGMDDWLALRHIGELATLFAPSIHPVHGGTGPMPVHGGTGPISLPPAAAVPQSATARNDIAPIGGRQVVPAEDYENAESDRPEVAVATVQPNTQPVAAAVVAPAPAPESSSRQPGWAQMFALVSGGAFILAAGALLGVRVLAPSNTAPPAPAPVAAAPTTPPPREAPPAEEVKPHDENPDVILDMQAIEGSSSAAHKAAAPSSGGAQQPRASANGGDKKQLTAEQKEMLERMGGGFDQGPSNIRAPSENARASGGPHGTGQLTAEQLSTVVLNGRKNLQRCYESALRGSASTETVRLDVDIQVSPSGNVTSVRTSGKGLPGMEECITRTVKMWRFPMSGEVTQTRFPVVFQPGA